MDYSVTIPTPRYVRQRWRVLFVRMRDHGECCHETRTIRINASDPPDVQASTIRHEFSHAISGCDEYNADNHELAWNAIEKLIRKVEQQ